MAVGILLVDVQVVQPLFFLLAEQIDLAGHQGQEEAALRIAYCDVDEACCSPSRVKGGLLRQLQDMVNKLPDGSKDFWHALHMVSHWKITDAVVVSNDWTGHSECRLRHQTLLHTQPALA